MKSELDSSYNRYRAGLTAVDIPLQEDLHKYMCIRLSGYLEQLMFEAISGFVSSATGGPAKNFAMSFYKKAPNLTPDALEKLIGRFGDPWKTDLDDFLSADERRNSLGALMAVRNKVAHGHSYRGGQLNVATYKRLVDDIHSWVVIRMLVR
ncbi:HEPN domain-containing protein [Streptomyces sp. LP05-1]|uniref:HEPN domain-containing protein n=1 Tax=Streptomyces pyxinae TaxID=2970734 RepID=A0ABT2CB53_9ACTN|nr:HEPN domain-containing protein [Streptomyces sp. LP05-1]MCS0634644.1 HEPN domain-containing protein [Streptomyces sp. LP05-1]